ncbi:MAG: Fur family transcriptional regulator [Acetivibrionales bacterium]|jgi:Fur family ferric uptake transcriptional regulator|nr:transcriptional repressor [Clostridiaceae bacterium]
MKQSDKYAEILKKGDLRATKQRYAILEVLDCNGAPVSAEDLYIQLKRKGIPISLSTVYRILDAFQEKGIVVRSNFPDVSKAVYELFCEEHHHHLLCVDCRRVFPVEGCPLEDYERLIEERLNFTVKGHNLEVYGHCKDCKKKT